MARPQIFQFTNELLREYSIAALRNASELIEEASLLYSNGHIARAYFLAVASIEETGKALLAFDAQGRNLANSAVPAKLKRVLENHSLKITSAFTSWILASPNIRESVMPAINLMIHLKHGREPSMYTDINSDSSKVQVPAEMVRTTAANDCIQLATSCIAHTRKHIVKKNPASSTPAQDELFAMKSSQFQKIANTEDFWWYYIAKLKSGNQAFAEAVIKYQKKYLIKGQQFKGSGNTHT